MKVEQVFNLAVAKVSRNYQEAVKKKGAKSPEAIMAQAQIRDVRLLQLIFMLAPYRQHFRRNEGLENEWGVFTSVLEICAEVYRDIETSEVSSDPLLGTYHENRGAMIALQYTLEYLTDKWGIYCPEDYYSLLF